MLSPAAYDSDGEARNAASRNVKQMRPELVSATTVATSLLKPGDCQFESLRKLTLRPLYAKLRLNAMPEAVGGRCAFYSLFLIPYSSSSAPLSARCSRFSPLRGREDFCSLGKWCRTREAVGNPKLRLRIVVNRWKRIGLAVLGTLPIGLLVATICSALKGIYHPPRCYLILAPCCLTTRKNGYCIV